MTKQEIFMRAIEIHAVDLVKTLLDDEKVNINLNDYAIEHSAENGYIDFIELILSNKRFKIQKNNNFIVYYAADNNHFDIVKLLLSDKRIDPTTNQNAAISHSSKQKIIDILWEDKRVKCTLENDFKILYDHILFESTHKKIKGFI
jgi:hypothetical protein